MRNLVRCCVLLALPTAVHAEPNVYDVGTRSQLFIDQFLVRDADRVAFTLHAGKKHAVNPVLKADQPWEGWQVFIYGSVLYDAEDKVFKMWYGARPSAYFDREVTCYATSTDGIRWQKPLVGTLKAKNGKPHNAVAAVELCSVFKEPAEPDAGRRYKMVCFVLDRGYVTKVSADGLAWKDDSPGAIVPIWYGEDVITAFYDPRSRQYVGIGKMTTPVRGRGRRCAYVFTSRDFVHWSKPVAAFVPDVRDDHGSLARIEEVRPLMHYPDNPNVMRTEVYGVGAYAAEDCTVAFPWMFTINANIPRYGNQEGISEVQLAVSRGLETWERPFRKPAIKRGQPGAWDSGFFTTAASALGVGDEVRLYYGGANYSHGAPTEDPKEAVHLGKKYTGAIGLVSWPRDRFVSADAPAEGASLTTVPVRFSGKRLEINAATQVGGSIRVELLDAGGKVLLTSEPVAGDDLRHAVRFDGDPARLAGRPVCLRFQLQRASLYSFAFR